MSIADSNSVKISVVSFKEAKEDIIAILNRNRSASLNESYFDWRYSTVFGEPVTCLAEVDGKKVGLLTLFPRPLKINNREVLLADLGHVSVDDAYRRKGIFAKLMEKAFVAAVEKGMNYCFCIPNEMGKKAFLKSGWKETGVIKFYCKVINTKSKFRKILKLTLLSEVLGSTANLLLRLFSMEFFVKSKGYNLNKVSKIGKDCNVFWQRKAGGMRIARIRDEKFLTWRFCDKPCIDGERNILELRRDNQLRGYVVIEIKSSKALIVDLQCLNGDILIFLRKIICYLRGLNMVNSISVAVPPFSEYTWALKLFGFMATKEQLSFCCYVVGERDDHSVELFMNMRNWVVTLADKDTI